MGGNALSVSTIRVDASRYGGITAAVSVRLGLALSSTARYAVIPSVTAKSSFGDMDVLLAYGERDNRTEVARRVAGEDSPVEPVENGPVTSIGLLLEEGVFQVDLVSVAAHEFDFALKFFSFGDLGGLMARFARHTGFKFGHNGLFYAQYAPNGRADHLLEEVPVTQDWDEAISFLGYNPVDFHRGARGEFRTPSDVFRFVTSTPFFHPALLDWKAQNSDWRRRAKKRPGIAAFYSWMQLHTAELPHYDWSQAQNIRETFLSRAERRFAGFAERREFLLKEYADSTRAAEKFNSHTVARMSRWAGPVLGQLMHEIRAQHASNAAFNLWVAQSDDAELARAVRHAMDKIRLDAGASNG